MHRALAICCVLTATWSLTTAAAAGQERLSVALEYTGPSQCPGDQVFWNALTARTRRVTPAEAGSAQVLLRVKLTENPRGVLGRLDIVRDGFATEPRYVEARECTGVIQALALTAALGIDPEALTRPPEPVDDALPPEPLPNTPQVYYDAPDPLPSTPLTWSTAFTAHALGALPVDLETSWGLAAGFSFQSEGSPNWSPSLRVGLFTLSSGAFGSEENATFALHGAYVRGCPLRLQEAQWQLRPCVALDLGVLDAKAQDISNPLQESGFWAALGAELELSWAVSESLSAQLHLGGLAPLTPQTYQLGEAVEGEDPANATRTEIARTPALAPWVGLGISTEI